MNLLFDTCTFIWYQDEPSRLSPQATMLLQDVRNTLWLSVVNVWEIIVKTRIGKLSLTRDIAEIVEEQVEKNDIRLLPLTVKQTLQGITLPLLHHDPFDRLLMCQALEEGLTIVTPDHLIRQYTVPTEW
jgi:PIN domain nuclease of toxin-antitoxin system